MQGLRIKLAEKGIETRTFFIPMHRQPRYKKKDPRFPNTKGRYPVSDGLARKGFSLPSSSTLKRSQIRYTAKTIRGIQANKI